MQAEPIRWQVDELLAQAEWLGALARRLADQPSRADDVVQDTWIAALRRPPERGRALRPWLAKFARNVARMHRRSEHSRVAREAGHDRPQEAAAPDELASRLEGQRMLVEAISRLEEPYRSTILLAYFEHLPAHEIARRQGLAAGTVRWRIKVALDALRSELDRHHGGVRRGWLLAIAPLVKTDAELGVAATSTAFSLQGVLLVQSIVKLGAVAAVLAALWGALAVSGIVPWPLGPSAVEVPVAARFQRIAAGLDGYLTSFSTPIEVREGRISEGVEIVLEAVDARELIEGSVLDPRGQPLPWAHVEYRDGSEGGASGSFNADEHGRFRLVLYHARPHDLCAYDREERYTSARHEGVEPGTQGVVLQLRERQNVEIVVRSASGEAIASYMARAFDPEGASIGARTGLGPHPGGRSELASPTQSFVIEVDPPGFELGRAGPFDLEAPSPLVIELNALAMARGRVTADGEPVR